MKSYRRIIPAVLIAAIFMSVLSGCRHSPTLEQIIYSQFRQGLIDYEPPFELNENNIDNEQMSDDLKDLDKEDDAERKTEQTPEGIENTNTDTQNNEQTQSGYDSSYSDNGQYNTSTQAPSGSGQTQKPDDSQQTQGGDNETGDGGTQLNPDDTVKTYKQVVDAYGNPVDVPENVGSVATTGSAAVMVTILGGGSMLTAVDENTAYNQVISSNITGAQTLWSGSGGSAISDDNFARLLELKPDVVIETSASKSITEQQAQQLTEAEISYLVIPEPSSLGNVEVAVKTLGEVLGDKSGDGGSNAPAMADKYVSWVESAVNAASAASGSRPSTGDDEETFSNDFYTLYIDGWDDSAYYRLYSEQYTTLEGYGCAVVKNGATTSCKTISSYLSYAGVTNTGSLYGITSKSLYFTPLISAYRTMEITGSMADGMVTAGQKLLEQDNASLGTANFPILLAADRHTANAILSSELWAVYPHINSGDGSFNSDGFLDEDGNLVRTQISGEYEIVVNPCGLACSWISGSCESVLESVWAAWRFYGGLTESEVRDYISDFYSTFYSYELSSNEIDQILEGN